ncbi:MAG: hypothetical protein DSZ27_02165 [Thiomicrospira sp.]|nr:MAG: hypothetical protein DSZ27_02165 [Thiomicrospira sp.]
MPQIKAGETLFRELYEFFGLANEEALLKKKARLFPTGNTELENQTTSIFLASLAAVKEYREELLLDIGVNKIRNKNINVHVFAEVQKDNKKAECRPDGLLVVTSGKNNPLIEWIAFIESKVGNQRLNQAQVDQYVEFGKEIGVDNIITISNYMVTSASDSPFTTRKRNFQLYHWSWTYLKVAAKRLVRAGVIEDPDHEFILTELRRYFDAHSKLNNFTNMGGKEWKEAVQKCRDLGQDAKLPKDCTNTLVESYKQEEKDIALQLTDRNESGLFVQLEPFKNDRVEMLNDMLEKHRKFTSTFVIDHDKNRKFSITVDFLKLEIECTTNISIDKGKAQAQTSSLINLFQDSGHTSQLLVNAFYPRNKTPNLDSISLQKLIEEKNAKGNSVYSTVNKDMGEKVKYFEVKTKDLLGAEFMAPLKFVDRIEDIAQRFLEHVVVNIK